MDSAFMVCPFLDSKVLGLPLRGGHVELVVSSYDFPLSGTILSFSVNFPAGGFLQRHTQRNKDFCGLLPYGYPLQFYSESAAVIRNYGRGSGHQWDVSFLFLNRRFRAGLFIRSGFVGRSSFSQGKNHQLKCAYGFLNTAGWRKVLQFNLKHCLSQIARTSPS